MRTRKAFYSSSTAIFQQIIIAGIGIIIPRIIVVNYGSEINGLIASITQFISYLTLIEGGLSTASIYSLYKPISENDFTEINAILSATKSFYNKIGLYFASIIIVFSFIYSNYIKVQSLNKYDIFLLLIILSSGFIIDYFFTAKYKVFLMAIQEAYIIYLAGMVQVIVNVIITIVLANLKFSIIYLKILAFSSILIKSFIIIFYVRIKYKNISFREKPNKNALNKRWDAFYLQLLGITQRGAPIIIGTIFLPLKVISVYVIYNMIYQAINNTLSVFTNGLVASFGDVIARNEKFKLKKSYNEFTFIYYSICSVVYSILATTIIPFIELYTTGVSDVNYVNQSLALLLFINGLLFNLKTPQAMIITSSGLFRETRIQSTIQALLIIVFGIIFAPVYGINGIIFASCLSNLYRDIDLIYTVSFHFEIIKMKTTFFRIIRLFITLFITLFFINQFSYDITNYFDWILYAFFVGVIGIIVNLINAILFEKKEIQSVLSRFKKCAKI